jgi:hypothetical protein
MSRGPGRIPVTLITVACLGLLALAAGADERRSGRVIAVDDRSGVIVIDEVGPWRVQKGVTQVTRHSIVVTPSTKITSHIRVNIPGRFQGDFLEVPFELGDVARGDFVTVECRREGGRLIASSIAVAEQASIVIMP